MASAASVHPTGYRAHGRFRLR